MNDSMTHDDVLMMLEAADDITIDTEGMEVLMGVSVAFDGPQQGFYLPFNHHNRNNLTDVQRSKLWQILSFSNSLIMHNAVHDLRVLARNGFDYRGWFWDTMLMAHWINEERFDYSLDAISKVYGGQPKAMSETMKRILETDGWDNVPVALMDDYSSNDSYITHRLFRKLEKQWVFTPELWAREQQFIRDVMGPMMDLGIKIDLEICIREFMRGQGIMEECKKELGFNPGSSKALEQFLIKDLGLPILSRTPTGRVQFTKTQMAEYDEMLDKRDDVRAQTILRYRGWQKTNSSNYKAYLDLVDSNGVLHPGYKLHGTKTGRLSCEKPNLQQIPKSSDKDWNGNLKAAFVARPGYSLWSIDYSQLQFRMTCAYANQEELLGIFNDRTRDIFTEMASTMGWLRSDVKTLVYLILFGGGAKRAKVAFNLSSELEGKELVEEFHSRYPEIRRISSKAQHAAMRQGYVALWTGRRRHFPRGSAYYRAFNAIIQGGEAEIIKSAMIAIQNEVCNENCRLILQIHDEIVLEIKNGEEEWYLPQVQKRMEAAGKPFCDFVGVEVDFKTSAGRWGEK